MIGDESIRAQTKRISLNQVVITKLVLLRTTELYWQMTKNDSCIQLKSLCSLKKLKYLRIFFKQYMLICQYMLSVSTSIKQMDIFQTKTVLPIFSRSEMFALNQNVDSQASTYLKLPIPTERNQFVSRRVHSFTLCQMPECEYGQQGSMISIFIAQQLKSIVTWRANKYFSTHTFKLRMTPLDD